MSSAYWRIAARGAHMSGWACGVAAARPTCALGPLEETRPLGAAVAETRSLCAWARGEKGLGCVAASWRTYPEPYWAMRRVGPTRLARWLGLWAFPLGFFLFLSKFLPISILQIKINQN